MLRPSASFFLLFARLLVLIRAGKREDFGGWFPPKDLSTDIEAKAASVLAGRADSPSPSSLQVICNTDLGYDSKIVAPPDMVLLAIIGITGLPNADNHADNFKKAIEETCIAKNLVTYDLGGAQGTNEMHVTAEIIASIRVGKEGVAPPFCLDDAIRRFTGRPDLPDCHQSGF